MDWLSQCVAYVKETLPPGTIVSGPEETHVRGNSKRGQQSGREGFALQENGKRRRLVQEEDTSKQSPANGCFQSRPAQYSWFHPSHPLHEDPRVTARRYNSGYDLESEVESLDVRTNGMSGVGNSAESRMGNGRRVKERSTAEQEPVNFERVIFAEQVLKPIYHSPYPEIKPDAARSEPKKSSSQRVQVEPRSPGLKNGVFKIINGGTGIRRRERSAETKPVLTNGHSSVECGLTGARQEIDSSLESGQEVRSSHSLLDDQSLDPAESPPRRRPVPINSRHRPRNDTDFPKEIHDDSEDEDYTPEATDRPKPQKSGRPAQNPRRYISHAGDESQQVSGLSKSARRATQADHPTTHPRSLWVCDRCFKYMLMESAYVTHTRGCVVNFPPGRKVYERANWGIWEIDGQLDKLYCQNLSLFGKLFIDHKSICFDVESFHYYVLTDSHPKRDHVIAYFCKVSPAQSILDNGRGRLTHAFVQQEKFSIDDFNLATILVFPHVQQSGFGRLLMEFSYHLTKNSPSPGTPERPLSLLGARSYESLWMAMLVRYLIQRLLQQGEKNAPRGRGKKVDTYMRVWERRKGVLRDALEGDEYLNYEDLKATPEELETQEEQVPLTATMTVEELARECNLKTDDLLCLLDALGVPDHRRIPRPSLSEESNRKEQRLAKQLHLTDWSRTQVTIDWELVVKITGTWRIPAKPLLDEACCWIRYTGGPLVKPVPKRTWVGYM